MVSIAGESYQVPCDFFDMNEGHFIHSRHTSNNIICHNCKSTYEEIHNLEKQHQKYLQMISSMKPAIPLRRKQLEPTEVKKQVEGSGVENNSVDSSLQNLNRYAVHYIQHPYQQWEVHIHNENEILILEWNKSTSSASKRMIITAHDKEYLLKFKVWDKNIDSIPSVPLKSDDLKSTIEEFHQDVITYLVELDKVNFCEGSYDAKIV